MTHSSDMGPFAEQGHQSAHGRQKLTMDHLSLIDRWPSVMKRFRDYLIFLSHKKYDIKTTHCFYN